MNKQHWIALTIATLLVGCGGSGNGLDSNGQPQDSATDTTGDPNNDQSNNQNGGQDGGQDGAVTLAQLQNDIFTPICAQCHIGAGAPQGLRLDSEDNSYQHLVNVDANEVPTLKLVAPGDPDASYLVHKVEGRNTIVGSRMPLGQSALSSQQIADIRSWISQGALQSSTSSSATQVVSVQVDQNDPTAPVQLRFSRAIDPDSFSHDNIQLTLQQGNDTITTQPQRIQVEGHLLTLWLPPQAAQKNATQYSNRQLHSLSLGADGVVPHDILGRAIDGDQDQYDGGAYEYRF